PTSVYETFPWPQKVNRTQVESIAQKAKKLRNVRYDLMEQHGINLRELYRTMDLAGENPLKDAHQKLDNEVRKAYGMKQNDSILQHLLNLNFELADKEKDSTDNLIKPGLTDFIEDSSKYISEDCIEPET